MASSVIVINKPACCTWWWRWWGARHSGKCGLRRLRGWRKAGQSCAGALAGVGRVQCSHQQRRKGINKRRHLQGPTPVPTALRGTSWVGVPSRSCMVSDTPTLTAQPLAFSSFLLAAQGCAWGASPRKISCCPVGRHTLQASFPCHCPAGTPEPLTITPASLTGNG